MRDQSAARRRSRAIEDLAAAGFDAPRRRLDVIDVEIVKPEGKRQRRGLGVHAADRFSSCGEFLIRAHHADMAVAFLPAKEIFVESERLFPVGGKQLMPAHPPRRARLGGPRRAGFQPFDQSKRRHLRVGDDRKAADVGDVGRRDVDRSAKLLGPVDGGVNVVDANIADPIWRASLFSSRLLTGSSARRQGSPRW